MTYHTTQTNASERGFTLVELAIVMIIIGLLIGGILKGQELIGNARVSSSVTQLKAVEAAINTFKDKYAALPGDMNNASTRLPGCTVAVCNVNGNGDGLVQTTGGDLGAIQATPVAGNESSIFAHLAAASLLTGSVQPTQAWSLQTSYPDFNLGGKIRFGYVPNATAQTGQVAAANFQGGHYMAVGNGGGTALTTAEFAAGDLGNIDRKLDDGQPNTGSVYVVGVAACASGTGAADTYSEQANPKACGLYVRALN